MTPSTTMPPLSAILAALLLVLLLSPLATSSPASGDDAPTAYDLLESFDFPIGLLPKGVTSYGLDRENGRFHATWEGTCSFSLEGSYQLKYQSTISGHITRGRLSDLTGVSVKVLFLWLNIVEVVRRGDDIVFSVGIASASFPIDNFFICPQCGCGLNCDSGGIGKLRFKVHPSKSDPSSV